MTLRITVKSIDTFRLVRLAVDSCREDYDRCEKRIKILCDDIATLAFRDNKFRGPVDMSCFHRINATFGSVRNNGRIDGDDLKLRSGWWGSTTSQHSAGLAKHSKLREELIRKSLQHADRSDEPRYESGDIDKPGIYIFKHRENGCYQYVGQAKKSILSSSSEILRCAYDACTSNNDPLKQHEQGVYMLTILLLITRASDWNFYFIPFQGEESSDICISIFNDILLKYDCLWPYGLNAGFKSSTNFVQLQLRKSALRHKWPPCDPDYTIQDNPMTLVSDIKEEHELHLVETKKYSKNSISLIKRDNRLTMTSSRKTESPQNSSCSTPTKRNNKSKTANSIPPVRGKSSIAGKVLPATTIIKSCEPINKKNSKPDNTTSSPHLVSKPTRISSSGVKVSTTKVQRSPPVKMKTSSTATDPKQRLNTLDKHQRVTLTRTTAQVSKATTPKDVKKDIKQIEKTTVRDTATTNNIPTSSKSYTKVGPSPSLALKSIPVHNGTDYKVKKSEKNPIPEKNITPKRTLALSRKLNMKIESMAMTKSKIPAKLESIIKSPVKSPAISPKKSPLKSPQVSPLKSSPGLSPNSPKPDQVCRTSTMTKNSPVSPCKTNNTKTETISNSPRHDIEVSLGIISKEGDSSPVSELHIGDLRKFLTDIKSSPENGNLSSSKGGQHYDYTEIIEEAQAAIRNSGRGRHSNRSTPCTSPNIVSPLCDTAPPIDLNLPSPLSTDDSILNVNSQKSDESSIENSPSSHMKTLHSDIKRATPPSTLKLRTEKCSPKVELIPSCGATGDILTGQDLVQHTSPGKEKQDDDIMLITFD